MTKLASLSIARSIDIRLSTTITIGILTECSGRIWMRISNTRYTLTSWCVNLIPTTIWIARSVCTLTHRLSWNIWMFSCWAISTPTTCHNYLVVCAVWAIEWIVILGSCLNWSNILSLHNRKILHILIKMFFSVAFSSRIVWMPSCSACKASTFTQYFIWSATIYTVAHVVLHITMSWTCIWNPSWWTSLAYTLCISDWILHATSH